MARPQPSIRKRTKFSRLLAGALIRPDSVISNITLAGGTPARLSSSGIRSVSALQASWAGCRLNAKLIARPFDANC
ncbi:hypothetical protein D3C76_1786820 [compost metagenome]